MKIHKFKRLVEALEALPVEFKNSRFDLGHSMESTSFAESLKDEIPKYLVGFFGINNTIESIQLILEFIGASLCFLINIRITTQDFSNCAILYKQRLVEGDQLLT
jgi:hypothetical protein